MGQELKEEERRYSESQLPPSRRWMLIIHLMLQYALRDLVVRVSTSALWGLGQFPEGAWFRQHCQLKTKRSSYTAVFHMKSCQGGG